MTRHEPPNLNPHPHGPRPEQSCLSLRRGNRRVELVAFAVAAALFYWTLCLLAQ